MKLTEWQVRWEWNVRGAKNFFVDQSGWFTIQSEAMTIYADISESKHAVNVKLFRRDTEQIASFDKSPKSEAVQG